MGTATLTRRREYPTSWGAGSLGAALFALSLLLSPGAQGAPESAEEIQRCLRDNLPRKSSVQTLVFRSTDRVDHVTESRATLYWKLFDDGLSKVMMRFFQPLDLRGSGLLMIEREGRRPDTMLYIPAIRKVRRVSSRAASSSLFGTDFSYEDFERLMGMSADAAVARAPDAEVAGSEVYVLEAKPPSNANSAYERVVTFVDKRTCIALKTESYDPGGVLRKRLVVDRDQITQENEIWVPRSQTIVDLRDQTQTELLIEKIEVEARIHRKMFSERELEAGAH